MNPSSLQPASQTINDEHASTANKQHILIVEDKWELRNFLNDSLRSHYHITEATDGQDGPYNVREIFPDLIISDLMMPGMDGIEFCKQVKENIETVSHLYNVNRSNCENDVTLNFPEVNGRRYGPS